MTEEKKPRRIVTARRTVALGAVVAGMSAAGAGFAASATTAPAALAQTTQGQGMLRLADADEGEGGATLQGDMQDQSHASSGEGGEGGEGGGSAGIDPSVALQRDLSFMEGHLRAGLALYEAGDLAAAKTQMGHPIKEKYDAVADPLQERGHGELKEKIVALANAAEAEEPVAKVKDLFAAVRAGIEEVRDGIDAHDQLMGLAELLRVAGGDYAASLKDGKVTDLHEYQDSWGFLRVVGAEAGQMAESDDATLAKAGKKVLGQVDKASALYGDLQGKGDFDADPSVLYAAASYVEIAALSVK